MARTAIGSYEGFVRNGDNLLQLIFDDIETKTGKRITNKELRHVTINSDDGNLFEINGFTFEIRNGIFATPSNSEANLIVIHSFTPLQDCDVQVYYIR
jgi:hypothetical protein